MVKEAVACWWQQTSAGLLHPRRSRIWQAYSHFFKVTVGKAVTGQGHRSWATVLPPGQVYLCWGDPVTGGGNYTGRLCIWPEPSKTWKCLLMPALISETRPCKQADLAVCYFYISFTFNFVFQPNNIWRYWQASPPSKPQWMHDVCKVTERLC